MSCVLRVHGQFDPDRSLAASRWAADRIWRRGEPTRRGVCEDSGFSVLVSEAGFDAFADQVRDAVSFLADSAGELDRLRSVPGLAGVTLDFGVAQRYSPAWSIALPAELVELAGRHRLAIELSVYAVSDAAG